MFPFLSLKGRPYEIGHEHGSMLRFLIRENIAFYFSAFSHYAGMGREDVISLARSFIPPIGQYDGSILDEIQGIADGSESSLEEIVALNARTEILTKSGIFRYGECTALASIPDATAEGRVLIGQNWDWVAQGKRFAVIIEIRQEGKPNILTLTEAGFVAKIGMNSSGLGLCVNLLIGPEIVAGVPFHVLCRGILNSSSLRHMPPSR